MYKIIANEIADKIEKQMKRYIKMMTTMDAQVYVELAKRGFKIDLLQKGNGRNVMVIIYRK